MVEAMLELNCKFAESKDNGTLVKIAYRDYSKDAEMIKLFAKNSLKSRNIGYINALSKGQVYYNETIKELVQPYVLLDETMMIPFEMWNSVMHKDIIWTRQYSEVLWHTMFGSYIPENDLE